MHDATQTAEPSAEPFPFEKHPPVFDKEPTGYIRCGGSAMPYWLPVGADPVDVVEVKP